MNRKIWLPLFILSCFVGMVWFLNWTFPFCSDDCHFGMMWNGEVWQRVGTVWNAFKLEVFDPHRPFVHFLTRIFCGCYDKWVFNVINALMMGVLMILINRYARRTWRLEPCSSVVAIAMVFFVLCKGESYLWMCGSVNYLWAGVMTLWFCIFREKLERDEVSALGAVLFIPIAAIFGEANESFSPPICIALAIYGLLHLDRLNWKKICIYGAYGIAAALLCLHETGRSSQIPPWTLTGACIIAAKVFWASKCVWIMAIAFLFVRDKREFARANAFELMVIGSSLLIDFSIGFVGERVLWVCNLMSIVLVLRMREFGWRIAGVLAMAVVGVFCALVPLGLRIRDNFQKFADMYASTKDCVVCHDYVSCGIFERFFFQMIYSWQPMGYHPTVFARAYGRPNSPPIALQKWLYDGVYLSDDFCVASNRLPVNVEAYSRIDSNTIVVPLPQDGIDGDANEVMVSYDYPNGVMTGIVRAWCNQGQPLIPYSWVPVKLNTSHGEYFLVAKEPFSDQYIKCIEFKRSNRPHPDAGAWYSAERMEK